jgi:hypothetical protein
VSFGEVEEMDGRRVEVDVEAVLGSLCQYSASKKQKGTSMPSLVPEYQIFQRRDRLYTQYISHLAIVSA